MRYLFDRLDWSLIECVGFDMDGTLYDEAEFISQSYKQISLLLGEGSYAYMTNRWFEKGSSYNKIFDEAYDLYSLKDSSKAEFISQALRVFRNFDPVLSLSARSRSFLEFLKNEGYVLFLVSDGNPTLQRKKFLQLGLDAYFALDKTIFTGEHGPDYHKPSTKCVDLLNIETEKSVFFGDRHFDSDFAMNAGMQFQKVYNMIPLNT